MVHIYLTSFGASRVLRSALDPWSMIWRSEFWRIKRLSISIPGVLTSLICSYRRIRRSRPVGVRHRAERCGRTDVFGT